MIEEEKVLIEILSNAIIYKINYKLTKSIT